MINSWGSDSYKTIIVRNGKGFKDRVVTFPDPLIQPIKNHLKI